MEPMAEVRLAQPARALCCNLRVRVCQAVLRLSAVMSSVALTLARLALLIHAARPRAVPHADGRPGWWLRAASCVGRQRSLAAG